MQKKPLFIACSAILGLSAGISPALASIDCPHPDQPDTCLVTGGYKATVTDKIFRIVNIRENSDLIMDGGEITHGGKEPSSYFKVTDNSSLTLNHVAVKAHGGNNVIDSVFTMNGGELISTRSSSALIMLGSTANLEDVEVKGDIGVYQGSTFTGRNLKMSTALGPNQPTFEFNLHDSNATLVDSTINGSFQITKSELNMTGGNINSPHGAFHETRDSDISFNNVNITTGGIRSGISFSNSHFSMTNGSITYTGTGHALSVSNSDVTLTGVNIKSDDAGIWDSHDYKLTITDSIIDSNSADIFHGWGGALRVEGQVMISNTSITAGSDYGIFVNGGDLSAMDFDIHTKNNQASAVKVNFEKDYSSYGKATLENGHIRTQGDSSYGIEVTDGASLSANNLDITTSGYSADGVVLYGGGVVNLNNVNIEVNTANGLRFYAFLEDARLNMSGGSITVKGACDGYGRNCRGVSLEGYSNPDNDHPETTLDGVSITMHHDNSEAVHLERGASIALKNSQIYTPGHGVMAGSSSSADIDNSNIIATGVDNHALGFFGEQSNTIDRISLAHSTATSTQSAAVVVRSRGNNQINLASSTLAGDRLVHSEAWRYGLSNWYYATHLDMSAHRSQLSGHITIDSSRKRNTVTMTLDDNSTWTLYPSSMGVIRSDVSVLDLHDSRINFDLQDSGLYQTLMVGTNWADTTAVYNASGNAQVHLNTWLNQGGAFENQYTDRLLINGDVSGTTWLTIHEVPGNPGGITGTGAKAGISVVQASGAAQEAAFRLSGGYVAMQGKPWRYELIAYGPGTANGEADAGQRLVQGQDPYWDWRLQSQMFVHQAPSYLASANALFKSNRDKLRDLRQQRRARSHSRQNFGALDADTGAFLFATGGSDHYRSDLSASAYGVDASITHSALQAGRTLYTLERAGSLLQVGLAGSSGSVSFLPSASHGVYRTRLDQQSIAPTVSWRNQRGAYVDAILDYGHFKGKVSTAYRGETARLRGSTQTLSIETGLPLHVGSWTLEPQAQVALQRAKFANVQDVDGFPVQLGAPQQWTLRMGGEMHKALLADHTRSMRMYGRMHLTHGFDHGNTVWLGEAFQLGGAGNTLESSLGLDAALRGGKTFFYGDITRQQYLGGIGGWSANLGLRLNF